MSFKIVFSSRQERDNAYEQITETSDFVVADHKKRSLIVWCDENSAKSFAESLGGKIDETYNPLEDIEDSIGQEIDSIGLERISEAFDHMTD